MLDSWARSITVQKALTPWGARQRADSPSEALAIPTDVPAIDLKASEVEARLDEEAIVEGDLVGKNPSGEDQDHGNVSKVGQKTQRAAPKSQRRVKPPASHSRSTDVKPQVRMRVRQNDTASFCILLTR